MKDPVEKLLKQLLSNEIPTLKEVSIDRKGKGTIQLPEGMSLQEGIYWLKQKQHDEETQVTISERIEGFPVDVAYVLQETVKEMFGFRELKSVPGGFFMPDRPPAFLSIPIDHAGKTTEIFIGRFSVPGAEGYLETRRELNDALVISGNIRQMDMPVVKSLLNETRRQLNAKSLYRGKAFRVYMTTDNDENETLANPEFIDLSYKPATLILNAQTTDLLRAALYMPIERSEQTKLNGVPLKRGILLYGHYGTGKSLTALETAQLCERYGWTFIYVKNVRDLKNIYQFAVRYSPAVVFAEDIDLVIKHENEDDEDGINMLNNVLDGVDTKDRDVVLVLTTNHIETLPSSLLRPGRFDAIIEYFPPDRQTAALLVRQYAGNQLDEENFDPQIIGDTLAGNIPATIHEIVKRAKLFAIGRYPPEYRGDVKLSTPDLLLSHASMTEHLRLLNSKPDQSPSFAQQFGKAVGEELIIGIDRAIQNKGQTNRAPEELVGAENRLTSGIDTHINGKE